ncbi:MAG: phosphate ABC transporter permease PstA [Calditrichaeota bacterium]|nr:phosphate ABC transporter permease PstA [Calditrichota bacterium]
MSRRISYFKQKGDPYIFASGLGLVVALGMVTWIIAVILSRGLSFFWPGDLVQITTSGDETYLGELWAQEDAIQLDADGHKIPVKQTQLKIGNRDLYGMDFTWIRDKNITEQAYPENAVTFERLEYGNFYGFIEAVHSGDEQYGADHPELYTKARQAYRLAREKREQLRETQEAMTELSEPLTRLQREISLLEISPEGRTDEGLQQLEEMRRSAEQLEQEIAAAYQALTEKYEKLYLEERGIYLTVRTAAGEEKELHLSEVVRFFRPNQMGVFAKSWHYAGKLWEFVADDPRESNTEGGVFPAIFGTVVMVLLMSIAVVPFGVMAAIYLNEYARQGPVTRLIRMSVNNLAGVPSIVFGVFGLGFFIYFVGGSIDQLFFSNKLPEPTFGTGGILWASLTLALLTLPVVVVATEEGLLAVPRANKEGALALGSTRWQMIRKVVLPNAMPGILTGLILAISRGAGEVAPLMITGVVKLAPTLALDTTFPFLHLDRKFMHLGFHIYDVGFQSPNVEAAKPMVYSTALLLIVIVVLLNIIAIYIRNNLRKKFKTSTF